MKYPIGKNHSRIRPHTALANPRGSAKPGSRGVAPPPKPRLRNEASRSARPGLYEESDYAYL